MLETRVLACSLDGADVQPNQATALHKRFVSEVSPVDHVNGIFVAPSPIPSGLGRRLVGSFSLHGEELSKIV
jgi:hypothetical protein